MNNYYAAFLPRFKKFIYDSEIIDDESVPFDRRNSDILRRATHVFVFILSIGVIIPQRIVYIQFTSNSKNLVLKPWITNLFFTNTGRIFGTVFILLLGYGLFQLKRKRQLVYGGLETTFAVVSGYYVIANIQKLAINDRVDIYVVIPIMTTIYLTVRGLTNIYEGNQKLKKSTEDSNYFLKSSKAAQARARRSKT